MNHFREMETFVLFFFFFSKSGPHCLYHLPGTLDGEIPLPSQQ